LESETKGHAPTAKRGHPNAERIQMIAPRTNLVVWAAAIILPLSILAGVVGSLRSVCILGIVVFLLASLVDLLLGLGKYRQLEFQIPSVKRVTAGRSFELDLKLNG